MNLKYFIEKQMCNKNTFRIRSYISIYTTHTKIKVSSKVYPLQQQCHPSKANTSIRIMFTLWFYLPQIDVRQIFLLISTKQLNCVMQPKFSSSLYSSFSRSHLLTPQKSTLPPTRIAKVEDFESEIKNLAHPQLSKPTGILKRSVL